MIKKILLLLVVISLASNLFAQRWISQLPQNKNAQDLTLFDYKNAFDKYWTPYNVDNKGYYLENGVKRKAAGWKQFHRWMWQMEGQINPETGDFPKKTAQQVYEEFIKSNPDQAKGKSANWSSLGPGSSGGGYAGVGRVNCIAFHPSDNNTYWIGAPAGGLWQTSDNGSSWSCLTDDNDILGVSDIMIPSDYVTSHTIYIATGDRDAWDNRSIGVLKSTDSGNTWNSTGLSYSLSQSRMVCRLLVDPNDNQTIIAATNAGVYKTTNGGTDWSDQLTSSYFIDMEYKPGDFNTLYGSSKYGDIYTSTNGGANWTQTLNTGNRIELAVSPANANYVYAIVAASNGGLHGIYKSTNSGGSFTEVFSGSTKNLMGWDADGGDSGGQGWYDLSIAVSSTDANTIVVGGVNSWRSTNGGTSWSVITHWWGDGVQAVHADKHMLKYRNNGDLFECNDGGIYFSNNDGSVFADKTNGMVISQMYKLGVSQLDPDEIITGLQDNGTKLLSAGNWDDVKGGDGMECIIDFTDVNIQYGTYVRGQISRTTNHWASSTAIEPASAGNGAWVTPYIIDPADNNTLYAGYANVWKTTNKGNSWTEISSMNTSNKIRSMAIAPSNSLVLYVADYSHIWSTTNGGNSWTEITGSLPVASSDLRSIAVKNDDPNTLWVTLSYYNTNAVYESTDGGSIWTNISNGLPEIPAYSIVQNAQVSSEVHLYVGTELGVYFKKGDDNWIEYNTGLPKVKVGELEIYYAANAIDSKLRMASYGRGLWETPMELENTDLPTVQTATPTDITDNSATVGGNVTNEGLSSVNERGVVWSTLANPTVADNKIIHGSTGTGAYSSSLIGLNSSTIYHTRAYAINTQGISYGGNQEFTTLCNTFSLPFAEGFESGVFPPNCWATYRGTNGLGTSYDWEESSDSQEGTKAAYVRYENVSGGLAEDWLVSPSITIEANTELSFFQKQEYSSDYGSMFYIKVSTTSQTDHASFSTLSSWGETGLTLLYSEKIIDLSAYAGQNIYLAFVFVNDNGDNWFIDNINITSSSITPTATITATPGCNTGTVTVTSDLSGIQTFYLTQDDGTVITSQTADATSIDFTGLADGTYRGKVEKAGQMSSLSSAVILVNNTNPAQPSAISGNTNPCEGTSETYSVTNVAGVSYAWSLPTGWTGSSTTNSITVTVGSASGDISVTPSNSCGNGAVRALAVTAENVPAQTSIITGNTNPCEGTSEIYSVTNVAGVTYAWSLPTGWAGSSTTNTITVTVGSGSGDILVTPSNSCGNGAVRALAVTAENVPAQTSIITGNTNPCEGTSETYSVTNVAGVSYAWSLPTGWTGSSTTNTITVTVGSGSGDVSVTPSNSCGDGTASMLGISVDNLPAQPSAISGNTNPCEGTSETYSVTNVAGVSYAWSLPTGWTGSSTTNTITVTVGPGSGDISVTPSNSCGDGIARVLAVTAESVPAQPSAISGNTNPCEGTSETYSVTNVAGVSYTWSLPTGWTGSSTTNSITVTVGTEDGELSVFASNTCGSSPISSAILDVEGIPDAPTSISGPSEVIETEIAIYEVGEVVDAENYEWELDPSWILENGAGTTQVTISFPLGSNSGVLSVFAENDCGQSGVSEMEIEISPIGVAENLESLNINMYPNPTKGLLKIELNQIIQNAVQIQVLTLTGKLVHQSKMKAGNHQINLDLSSLAPGSYIIGFDHNLTNRKFKIVITK